MISVLLVDDEKLALDYLANLIKWENYGYTIAGTATDGEQALQLYARLHPDIIITDVKMPNMSGIDLAMAVRDSDADTRIVFLSSYTEFSFVKQAIRLGVDDYLLKSDLNESVLIGKLLETRDTIRKTRKHKLYTLRKMLQDIFLGVHTESHYRKWVDEETYLKLVRPYKYLMFIKRDVMPAVREYLKIPYPRETSPIGEIQRFVKTVCTDELLAQSLIDIDDSLTILFVPPGRRLSGETILVKDLAQRMADAVSSEAGGRYSIAYSEKSATIHEFGNLVSTQQSGLDARFLDAQPSVISLDGTGSPPVAEKNETDDRSLVAAAIPGCDTTAVDTLLAVLNDVRIRRDQTRFCRLIRLTLEALSQSSGNVQGERSGRIFVLESEVDGYDLLNPNDVVSLLREKIARLSSIIYEKDSRNYSQPIERMIAFIRDHFADASVSLTEISDAGGLSPAWATSKFKDEVGIGINEYLNEYRIDRACGFFDSGDYMIYEVADLTGFTSSQYFSKVFRKYTGKTPNQYKEGSVKDRKTQ